MRAVVAYIWFFVSLTAAAGSSAQTPIAHEYFEYQATDADVPEGRLDLPRPGAVAEAQQGESGGAPPVATANGLVANTPNAEDAGALGGSNAPESVDDAVQLDRDTEREGQLQYAAVFSPAVTPFKRLGARDSAIRRAGQWALAIGATELTEVPLAEEREGDVFFQGHIVLDAREGVPIPLPSVAPDMRIHAVQTSPRVVVRFFSDGAGNFYATANRTTSVDLRYFVSARPAYFGGPLPPARALSPSSAPSALRADAATVLRAIGADHATTDIELLNALLRWFRAFDARPFPDALRGNNAYLDLALQRIGVCRHRAQTFVLTALAAGLPARYVYNDAHAFVEVELSDGWRRFDLGGASAGLDVLGPQNATFVAPADPTTNDAPISGSPTTPENGGRGSSSDAGTAAANGDGSASRDLAGNSSAEEPGFSEHGPTTDASDNGSRPRTLGDLVASQDAPSAAAAEVRMVAGQQVVTFDDAPPIPARSASRIELGDTSQRVFRGEPVSSTGRLVDDRGAPLPGRVIEVHLGPRDPNDLQEMVIRIGEVVTDGDGRFSVSIPLSSVLPLGQWGLYFTFAGDAEAGPAPPP